jgi:hypothetical protein
MWWVRHERLSKEHLIEVDWDGTEHFMVSLPPAKRRWVTKTASLKCGVGTSLLRWNYQVFVDVIVPVKMLPRRVLES